MAKKRASDMAGLDTQAGVSQRSRRVNAELTPGNHLQFPCANAAIPENMFSRYHKLKFIRKRHLGLPACGGNLERPPPSFGKGSQVVGYGRHQERCHQTG
ncbi:hypothetical protein TCAP_03320 [Tolypocladium capitatum]|uniref:Uncharacterized protein n=1 Tax=Tolypocladium capitatum TaxID=45235 RepID=A0A2K3QGS7_9HYPO|nr:hypothetical protein TCAP_03320 [Tolypocladium capitatum]